MNPHPPIYSKQWDVPAIASQTPWKAGIFNFGNAMVKGTDYFNCSIVQRPDGLWLVTRRSKLTPNDKLGMNDVMAFSLDGVRPLMGYKVRLDQRFEMEHFEDPRSITHNGKVYVSCCNFLRNLRGCTFPHQIICEVDSNWEAVHRYDPVYGKNGNDTGNNTHHEKNWLWFFHDDLPHLIYRAQPHVVAAFYPDFTFADEYTTATRYFWEYGEIRGGTPPVRVGDEYWTFFHSSTPWTETKRQYHMGAYAFEAKPPFRMTRITPKPLLSGSRFDKWFEGKPLVAFPGGSVLRDGKWLVVGGSNDLECFWMDIPHEELVLQTICI